MSSAELAVVTAVVFGAGIVQALSGFGFALLAVPLMTLQVPTKEAVVIATLLGSGVTVFQAWHGRRNLVAPVAARMVVGGYLGMPLGLWVFVAVDEQLLQVMLGMTVLTAVVVLATRFSLTHVGGGLDLGAGFVSGVLNTSLATNGPPLVVVLHARHLAPDEFRATLSTVFACCNVLGLTLFIAAGKVTGDGLLAAAVALPALIVGQCCGFPLRRHVRGERFRVMVLGLLTVAALTSLVSALG